MFLVKSLFTFDHGYMWFPKIEVFIFNITRIKTWLNFLLTLGIPGLLAFHHFVNIKKYYLEKRIELIFLFGYLLSNLLFAYSIFSAHADGRFVWTSYAFTIPLALYVVRDSRFYKKLILDKIKMKS